MKCFSINSTCLVLQKILNSKSTYSLQLEYSAASRGLPHYVKNGIDGKTKTPCLLLAVWTECFIKLCIIPKKLTVFHRLMLKIILCVCEEDCKYWETMGWKRCEQNSKSSVTHRFLFHLLVGCSYRRIREVCSDKPPIIKRRQKNNYTQFSTNTDLVMEEYISLSSCLELLEMLLCWNGNKKIPDFAQIFLDWDIQGRIYSLNVLFTVKIEHYVSTT